MSGPEVVAEVASLSLHTWDSKSKNTIRLLDDNGYKGKYTYAHLANFLTVVFFTIVDGVAVPIKQFDFDLSKDTTERQFMVVVDDFFGTFEGDRSYDWEADKGPSI